MNEIIMGIIAGAGTGLATTGIYALIRRLRVKTKNDEAIERLERQMHDFGEGQKVLFKLLLPVLLAVKGGKPNGELTEALHLYNQYMQDK